jgi:hypothetical protein
MVASRKTAKRSRRFSGRQNLEPLESRILLSATSTVQLSLIDKPLDDVSGSPQNLSPAMIEQAYDFDNLAFSVNGQTVSATGAGETIAIVDAFGDPDISSDLETFDANFGITNDNANGQFVLTVATPGGGAVQTNAGWATEESLDVEWAHAIAPEANILLVEANSDTVPALTSAAAWAADQAGVVAVSMSWGDSPEFAGETAYDSDFTTPTGHEGVTFVAASGDDGEPNYPSTSPDVLAVGGTTLNVDDNGNWLSESAWDDSGGGVSPYEHTNKPDVAYDGDPNTGFLVYDSIPYQGNEGWQVVGGTSAGSPQWAAIIALVDQGRALRGVGSLDGASQTIPDLHALPSSDFNEVTGGGLTGLGSPNVDRIVNALVGGSVTLGSASQVGFVQEPTTVYPYEAISPSITVDVEDSAGHLISTDDSTVTLSLAGGPGTLGGTLTATAVNGVATFNDVVIDTPGRYTLSASDGSLSSATSVAFTVAAPGWVDVANWGQISGWAFDPTDPSASIDIEVQILDGTTQTFSADMTRSDLQNVVGSTNHGFDYSTPMLSTGSHQAYIYAILTNGTKMLLGTETIVSQNSLFDESYYLQKYPTVAAAVADEQFASGYAHYLEYGQYEGFSPNPYWNEAWYLANNPDVAQAVALHTVTSGFMQYYQFGQYENRGGLLYFNNTYYLQNNADVAAAIQSGTVTSAFEHFSDFGQYEGRSAMLYFSQSVYEADNQDILPYITGEPFTSAFEQYVEYGQFEGRVASDYYDEQIYLADNPDVAAAVNAGKYPDGFIQWLEYGQYEGRTAV